MSTFTVNVIGAGLAGLSASLELSRNNIHVNLVSAQPSERAQSVMAEGGINAAMNTMGDDDTTREHFDDTLKGGAFIGEKESIEGMTENAPLIVEELIKLGVPFNNENGKISLRYFGGQKKRRTAFSRSSTGKLIMSAMIDAVRQYEARGLVRRFPHHIFEGLDIRDNGCSAVLIRDNYSLKALRLEGPVILATGGMNSLFPGLTTGTTVNTGDVTSYLYSIGLPLSNLEFIQFHPTTAKIEGKRCLISEAARGEGGRLMILRDGKPWYFMEEKYPELGNLMPRDVTSREIVMNSEDGYAFIDMTGLPSDTWKNKLSDMREQMISLLGSDPVKDYIRISPGIHYFMGGIYVDKNHKTTVDGLYAAGECACRYHGGNRLGGNSMLGALYGGKVAASSIEGTYSAATGNRIEEIDIPYEYTDFVAPSCVTDPLVSAVGIIRDGQTMEASLRTLNETDPSSFTEADRRRLLLSRAILTSAIMRKESRGAHYRTDYPNKDDVNFKAKSVITYTDGRHELKYEGDES
ncbi:MAG: FAD-binding protein [Clostridiales bacterium]|nr:FAD-binding protein [Clostridiales bacterium]